MELEYEGRGNSEIEMTVPPYSIDKWMTDLYPYIKHLRVSELSLPSAHNSGMDDDAPYHNSYITCQDGTFDYQMHHGVRVLDIRLKWFHGYGADNVNSGLRFTHGGMESGRTFANMLHDIDRFQEAFPGEIIILDFHEFSVNNSAHPVPYAAIHAHFMRHYTRKMLPRSAVDLTLEQIRAQYPGPRVIVAGPSEFWWVGVDKPPRDRTYMWDQIPHQWVGSGEVSSSRLERFIQEIMENPPFNDDLWSMSATAYGVYGPINIVDQLATMYPTGGERQNKSNIINYDWCPKSKSGLIRQCAESNIYKKSRVLKIISPANGARLFEANPLVRGVGVPGARVQLYMSGVGGDYGSAVIDANGDFEIRSSIPAGNFLLTAKMAKGNRTSRWTPDLKLTVFSGFPVPAILTPTRSSLVSTLRPQITGTGEPGATVRLYQAGSGTVLFGTAVVGIDGKWIATPTTDFPEGRFSLTCDAFLGGNTSAYADPVTFNVLPEPLILVPVKGSTVPTLRPQMEGLGVAGATIRLYHAGYGTILYGTTVVGANKKWVVTPTVSLPLGEFSLTCDQVFGDVASGYTNPVTFKVVDGGNIPSNFRVTSNANASVSFAWGAPVEDAALVIGYTVMIFGISKASDTTSTSHTLNTLMLGFPTVVGVRCRFKGGGVSEWNKLTVIPE